MAVEGSVGRIVHDALEEFVAFAVGLGMFDEDIVVEFLLLVDEIESVNLGVASLAKHSHLVVVAYMSAVERDGEGAEFGTLVAGHVVMVQQATEVVHVLKLVVLHTTFQPTVDACDSVRHTAAHIVTVVTVYEFQAGTDADDNEVAGLEENGLPAVGHRHYLELGCVAQSVGDIDEDSIGFALGIELLVGVLAKHALLHVFLDQVGTLPHGRTQTAVGNSIVVNL